MKLTTVSALTALSVLTNAHVIKLPSPSTQTMQLSCAGMPPMMCYLQFRTTCGPNGQIMNAAPLNFHKGDCSPAHCSCALGPEIPCATGKGGEGTVCGFGAGDPVSTVAPAQASSTVLAPGRNGTSSKTRGFATVTVTVIRSVGPGEVTSSGGLVGLPSTTRTERATYTEESEMSPTMILD